MLNEHSFKCDCEEGYVLSENGRNCELEDPCLRNNGFCQHNCQSVGQQAVCSCDPGFKLDADGKKCIDIDECVHDNGGCSGICTNTEGSFFCSCQDGYDVGEDGFTCYKVVIELISRKKVIYSPLTISVSSTVLD